MYGSQKSTDLCSCANIQTDVDGCVEWVTLRDFYVTKMENDKHFQTISEHFFLILLTVIHLFFGLLWAT